MLPVIQIVEGDDRFFFLPMLVDGSVPTSIDDWEIWMTGKLDVSTEDDAAAFQLTLANGLMEIYDSANCIARAHLLPAHTKGRAGQKITVDVQTRRPGPITDTALRCTFNIVPESTRA